MIFGGATALFIRLAVPVLIVAAVKAIVLAALVFALQGRRGKTSGGGCGDEDGDGNGGNLHYRELLRI
jgi:Na+/citrate or Na+/malate symporter